MTTFVAAEIRTAPPADQSRIVETLTAAFADDPAVRWMYPGDAQYRCHFPGFVRAFGGRAFAAGAAHASEGLEGAALWLPPGIEPDEDALVAHLERSTAVSQQAALFAVFEEMGAYHPEEPHWYLPLIGVAPSAQGRGSARRCCATRSHAATRTG
jgi:ribosomal protein S18 acetylase RimI-like enzyme